MVKIENSMKILIVKSIKFVQLIKESIQRIFPQLIAILVAFLLGAIVLIFTGYNPVDAYYSMIIGAFGDIYGIGQTLTQATPIIFTALAFLFSFKSGLFNIGAEGQFIVGAFAAAITGIYIKNIPSPIHIILSILIGAFAGGVWGLIPGILKNKFGAHEVITTMMLTYVAINFTGYLVNYPFKAPGWVSQTLQIEKTAQLPRILPPTQLSASLIIAVLLAIIINYILQRTSFGYELRASGLNPLAAENGGINVKRTMLYAFIISGAFAGIGGAGEIMGVHYRFIEGFSPGYGFDGLAVALVGGLNPIGIIFAGLLFGALRSGGMLMSRATHVPLDIVTIIQALVIIFVAAPTLLQYILNWRRNKS
ncbi:ABC transporter permease [Candidatus Bathyarchaeota archaeon]|nr:ABC transporter permease [Candidatus Bathyarchaeota archaeon]